MLSYSAKMRKIIVHFGMFLIILGQCSVFIARITGIGSDETDVHVTQARITIHISGPIDPEIIRSAPVIGHSGHCSYVGLTCLYSNKDISMQTVPHFYPQPAAF